MKTFNYIIANLLMLGCMWSMFTNTNLISINPGLILLLVGIIFFLFGLIEEEKEKRTKTILSNRNNTYKSEALAREEESKKGMDGSQITNATNTHEDSWKYAEINNCKTMTELTKLYSKAQDERIKKLFAKY